MENLLETLKKVGIAVGFNIGYHMKEGFISFFKNKRQTIVSIIAMFITLFLVGIFLVLSTNLDKLILSMEKDQGINVQIKLDATDEEIKKLGEEIKKIDGVESIKYRTKAEAKEIMMERFKDQPSVIEGLTTYDDFLPASYIVKLSDLSKNNVIEAQIEKLLNVKSIQNKDDIISTVVVISKAVKGFIIFFTVALALGSAFLISGTIKLSLYRKKERNFYYEVCRCNK